MQDFADSIRTGKPTLVTLEDTVEAVATDWAEAANGTGIAADRGWVPAAGTRLPDDPCLRPPVARPVRPTARLAAAVFPRMWNRLGRIAARGISPRNGPYRDLYHTQDHCRRRTMIKSINIWAMPGGLANEIDPVDAMRQAKDAGFDGIELGIGEKGAFNMKTKKAACEAWAQRGQADRHPDRQRRHGPVLGLAADQREGRHPQEGLQLLRGDDRAGGLAQGRRGAGRAGPGAGGLHPEQPRRCPTTSSTRPARTPSRNSPRSPRRTRSPSASRTSGTTSCTRRWRLARFVDEIKSRWVGVYFDVGNPVAFGVPPRLDPHPRQADQAGPPQGIQARPQRRRHGLLDKFPQGFEVPFGEGDVNWPAVKKALKQVKYDGPATVEVLNFSNDAGLVKKLSKQVDKVMF